MKYPFPFISHELPREIGDDIQKLHARMQYLGHNYTHYASKMDFVSLQARFLS